MVDSIIQQIPNKSLPTLERASALPPPPPDWTKSVLQIVIALLQLILRRQPIEVVPRSVVPRAVDLLHHPLGHLADQLRIFDHQLHDSSLKSDDLIRILLVGRRERSHEVRREYLCEVGGVHPVVLSVGGDLVKEVRDKPQHLEIERGQEIANVEDDPSLLRGILDLRAF